jgi:pimeloyl-ACP methyl ester carboxylesterase
MTNLLKISLVFVLFSVKANLIDSSDLFANNTYKSFDLSPSGEYMLSKVEMDGYVKILAFKSETKSAIEVFELSQKGSRAVYDYGWIDNDSAYVEFKQGENTRYVRFIDFTFTDDGGFDIDYFDLSTYGVVIDEMPEVENTVLYSKWNSYEDYYELFELDVSRLKGVPLKKQYRQFSDYKNLTEYLEDTTEFYVSKGHELNMIEQTYDDYYSYSIFDKETKRWNEFYRFSTVTDDENNADDLDKVTVVFKPVAVVGPSKIIAISNIGRDKSVVVLFDTKAKKELEVIYSSESYDVNGARLDRQGNLEYVSLVEKGSFKRVYLKQNDTALQVDLIKRVGVDNIYIVGESLDKSQRLVYATDSSQPGKFYHYNSSNDKLRFLQSSLPDLYGHKFSKGEYLSAQNENNQLVEGFLYKPQANGRNPLIVMPHGGPIGIQDVNHFDREVQFLVNRGFAVLKVNFRGSSGYGKEFTNSGRGELGQGIERDIHLIVDKALSDRAIDRSKVCIYGQSYGGFSAVSSVIKFPDLYKCAISGFGIFDLPLLFGASNIQQIKEVKKSISRVVGDIDGNYTKLLENSPLYHAKDIKVPVLLMAGAKDFIASPEHSRRMNYVMNILGSTSHQYIEFLEAGHGHGIWNGERFQYLILTEFLDKQLGIERDYAKEKASTVATEFYALGYWYYEGVLVEKDTKLAEKYLRIAHQYGSEKAAKYLRRIGVYDI